MLTPPPGLKVLVATKPIDFRKGADGLAVLAQEVLKQSPLSGTAFVFRAKRADRVKILVWDGSGLVGTFTLTTGANPKHRQALDLAAAIAA